MRRVPQNDSMNVISNFIIKKSFDFSVFILEKIYQTPETQAKEKLLKSLPKGTLGNDIYLNLQSNNVRLIPKFENHDLKHTLLNYPMTPLGEIEMQAFLLGNRNYTFPTTMIFIFGFLLFPYRTKAFREAFKRGRNTIKISEWTIEEFCWYKTNVLLKIINSN